MTVSVEVVTLFLRELASRGISVEALDDGRYAVQTEAGTNTISLDNISKDFEQDRDPDRVRRFVDTILSPIKLPSWDEARAGIHFVAEPADHDFGDTIREKISDEVCRVLAHLNPAGTQIMWLSPELLADWGQSLEFVEHVASLNLAALLSKTELHIEEIDGHRLGMFITDSPFKASLIFSPNLKEVVGARLGWPLLAVIPCRDFAYVVGEADRDLVPRLGPVVVREYKERGYPLSTEVFRISDEGIEAIAEFKTAPKEAAEESEPDDELQTVNCDGVRFRIPAFWEAEDEDDGPMFFDPDEESGTLRVRVKTFEFKGPVDADTAIPVLEKMAREHGTEVVCLPNGRALASYTLDITEEDEQYRMWVWQIANPILPRYLRTALFTFTVHTDLADTPEIVELVALLDRELRQCEFATTIE